MTSTSLTLEEDIPCIQCGYNLRGLDPTGRCPECGGSVARSVLRWDERWRAEPTLIQSGAAWIDRVIEGLVVALVSFALMVTLALAPVWMFAWKSPQRNWTLGTAVVAWVLSCLAGWKVAVADRAGLCVGDGSRRALRISSAVYLGSAVIADLLTSEDPGVGWIPLIVSIIIPCIISGAVASVMWFVYLARLASRAGSRILSIEARVLAVANLFVYGLSLLPEFDVSPDSLSGMLRTHMIPFGAIKTLWDVRLDIQSGHVPHWLLLCGITVPLWSVAVIVRLMIRMLNERRRAALAEKTPASSDP